MSKPPNSVQDPAFQLLFPEEQAFPGFIQVLFYILALTSFYSHTETVGAHLTNKIQFMHTCFRDTVNLPSVTKKRNLPSQESSLLWTDKPSAYSRQGCVIISFPRFQVDCHYVLHPFVFLTKDQDKKMSWFLEIPSFAQPSLCPFRTALGSLKQPAFRVSCS